MSTIELTDTPPAAIIAGGNGPSLGQLDLPKPQPGTVVQYANYDIINLLTDRLAKFCPKRTYHL